MFVLEKSINEFVKSRIETIKIKKTKKLINIEKDTINLFNKIIFILPKDKQNLLFKYENKLTELLTCEIEESYKKGFIDSLRILNYK